MDAELLADALELEFLTGTVPARPMSWVRQGSRIALTARASDLDLAVATMSRRARVLGDRYPIQVSDAGLKMHGMRPMSPYEAMLLMTTGQPDLNVVSGPKLDLAAELFEHMVKVAAIALLGTEGRAVRFGHPGEPGRPPEFPLAITWLAQLMRVRPGTAYRDPARKDGGVDVVAWRPFPDGRPGFPIYLIQATLEKSFAHKVNDINVRLWSLLLGLDVDPTCILAVPRALAEDKRWAEIATKAILLERTRLTGLISPDLDLLADPKWTNLLEGIKGEFRAGFEEHGP